MMLVGRQGNDSGFLKNAPKPVSFCPHESLQAGTSSSVPAYFYAGKTALILKQGRKLLQGYALHPVYSFWQPHDHETKPEEEGEPEHDF